MTCQFYFQWNYISMLLTWFFSKNVTKVIFSGFAVISVLHSGRVYDVHLISKNAVTCFVTTSCFNFSAFQLARIASSTNSASSEQYHMLVISYTTLLPEKKAIKSYLTLICPHFQMGGNKKNVWTDQNVCNFVKNWFSSYLCFQVWLAWYCFNHSCFFKKCPNIWPGHMLIGTDVFFDLM